MNVSCLMKRLIAFAMLNVFTDRERFDVAFTIVGKRLAFARVHEEKFVLFKRIRLFCFRLRNVSCRSCETNKKRSIILMKRLSCL